MSTTATPPAAEKAVQSKKAAPATTVCQNPECGHPKQFHRGSKMCTAYGVCGCKRFRLKPAAK